MLRFEQLRFSGMQTNTWNGKSITTIRVAHTVNCEKQSPMKKQKLDVSDSTLSVRDGTRLSKISKTTSTSPYLADTGSYSQPQPPLALTSYSSALKDAASPFRATILGIIHELEETETTGGGELRRNFKLADDHGMWVNCVAHGKHADSALLVNMNRIVVYFGAGRSATGSSPQTIWLFKDAFIVPLERGIVPPLMQQVMWK